MITLGNKLKKLRLNNGLTQENVALELKVDRSYIANLERDVSHSLNESRMDDLAKIYRYDRVKLIAFSGRMHSSLNRDILKYIEIMEEIVNEGKLVEKIKKRSEK